MITSTVASAVESSLSGVKTDMVPFGDALLMSLLGVGLVFLVLAFLAFFIWLLGKVINAVLKKKQTPVAPAAPAAPAARSRGPVRLCGVSEKDAALIMAIVADSSGIPLDNLDFKSICLVEGK